MSSSRAIVAAAVVFLAAACSDGRDSPAPRIASPAVSETGSEAQPVAPDAVSGPEVEPTAEPGADVSRRDYLDEWHRLRCDVAMLSVDARQLALHDQDKMMPGGCALPLFDSEDRVQERLDQVTADRNRLADALSALGKNVKDELLADVDESIRAARKILAEARARTR